MRILIAEDDRISRHVLQTMLVKWGYEVVVAYDGGQAWEELQKEDAPRLAILDWMMPGMDGPTLFRAMKEKPETAALPVIFITAKATQGEIGELTALGAAGAISKPFNPKELPDQLRAIWAKLP
jgi:sigma-B regulation protein RsbU (phosphoserine phosphatase)